MSTLPDLLCFSHLRWDHVFQRPQHLMGRFAKERRVFFIEECVEDDEQPRLLVSRSREGVHVVTPHLSRELAGDRTTIFQHLCVDRLLREFHISDYVSWYLTPMAVPFSGHLGPRAVVWDCMDELSGFAGAPPELKANEARLLELADVVFTGGHSLYEAKRGRHDNVHAMPSAVDVGHFARARVATEQPAEVAALPHPRLGFVGVIDERMDIDLLREIARRRPSWPLVMIGPVCKIDPKSLPTGENVHYLGGRAYDQLPGYLAAFDVALLPFAHNNSTRYISPTKTPEYLAAGKPVVSTSIRDVVRPYGEKGLVRIADTPDDFIGAVEACLTEHASARRAAADLFLSTISWDSTFLRMKQLLEQATDADKVEGREACSTI